MPTKYLNISLVYPYMVIGPGSFTKGLLLESWPVSGDVAKMQTETFKSIDARVKPGLLLERRYYARVKKLLLQASMALRDSKGYPGLTDSPMGPPPKAHPDTHWFDEMSKVYDWAKVRRTPL